MKSIINFFKNLLIPFYYFGWERYLLFKNNGLKSTYTNAFDIPIIINNRNRLTFLTKMIEVLNKKGYHNIFIIDNNSNYKPLLEYYDTLSYKIFRLKKNVGFLSLWQTDIYKEFEDNYFVYSDSDVVPVEDCPDNFLQIFLDHMKTDKKVMKIGLGLKIDDLPDFFANKNEVITWEQQYYENSYDDTFYLSNVDTTFALYRPYMSGGASRLKMFRSKSPMEAHHLPWYNNTSNLSEEEIFYIKNAKTSTHWTSKV